MLIGGCSLPTFIMFNKLIILSIIFPLGQTKNDAVSSILEVGRQMYGQSFDISQLILPIGYQNASFNSANSMPGFHFYNIQGFVLVNSIQDCLKFCSIYEPCRAINYVDTANLCVSLATKTIDAYALWKDARFNMQHAYFIDGPKANPPITVPIPNAFRPGVPMVPTNAYSRGRIIGGTEPIPHSFPWIVKIMICLGGQLCQVCGGSIIPPKIVNDDGSRMSNIVVTAAHCVISGGSATAPGYVKIAVAHHRDGIIEPFEREVRVRRIVTSKGYDSKNVLPDVALIQLMEFVEYSRYILSLRLPSQPRPSSPEKCIVVGWGKTSDTDRFASSVLQQVVLNVFTDEECDIYWDKTQSFAATNRLCAGSQDGKGTCGGDSGGSLFCPEQINENEAAFVLYGLTSYGHIQSCTYKPNVFTRVYSYLPWMINVVTNIDTFPDNFHTMI